ncbi:MAG: DUF2617 family protein [Phycisphaerae bacterium]|nr:DUF2617 family protein [Phycisphaerae bacterium]
MRTGQVQGVSKLRFFLYGRPVHPEFFDIYHDHRIVKNGYEADIWITGCTHVISFYRERYALVELTSNADAELPSRGMLLTMPFCGERDHQCQRGEGINYMMNFQVETMSPGVYSKTHHDLARLGSKKGLFVPFPAWMSGSLTPFTYIDYSAKPNELHIFTFHAFPQDLAVVKTQSIFELA